MAEASPSPSAPPSQPSLVSLPLELCSEILSYTSATDFVALRLVSRTFHRHFTSPDLCRFALRHYFPSSVPSSSRFRTHFDLTYRRTERWKRGSYSYSRIIDGVAAGSTLYPFGFLVDEQEHTLVYPRSRNEVVLTDLNGLGKDVVLNLRELLGPCVALGSSINRKEGQRIGLRLNQGILIVIGEGHSHMHSMAELQAPTQESMSELDQGGLLDRLWGFLYVYPPIHHHYHAERRRWWNSTPMQPPPPTGHVVEPPHTLCAAFSIKGGELLHTWHESDAFLDEMAHNSHYCIGAFDIRGQRLAGFVFPTSDHEGHHFTLNRKQQYPQFSTFDVTADTRGKVFYLCFISGRRERRPVVEVISIPELQEDGTWTEPTVIKRVTLRSCISRSTTGLGLTYILSPSYEIEFQEGTTAKALGYTAKDGKDPDEDMVRLELRGDFFVSSITDQSRAVYSVQWDITARPSTHKPAAISKWREGREWEDPELDHLDKSISPYADANGNVDLDEVYPRPTYFTRPRNPQFINDLPIVSSIDLDRLQHLGRLTQNERHWWTKDSKQKYRTEHTVYSAPIAMMYRLRHPDPPIQGISSSFESVDAYDRGRWVPARKLYAEAGMSWPVVPGGSGLDDEDFVPAGEVYEMKWRVSLRAGDSGKGRRPAKNMKRVKEGRLPLPGFETGKMLTTQADVGGRWLVYPGETEGEDEKIIVVRFD